MDKVEIMEKIFKKQEFLDQMTDEEIEEYISDSEAFDEYEKLFLMSLDK